MPATEANTIIFEKKNYESFGAVISFRASDAVMLIVNNLFFLMNDKETQPKK